LLLGWFVTITLIPAVVLIGLWFLPQLLSEVGNLVEHQSGGVACVAHIAGLLYGVVGSRVFAPATRGQQ
jgi:membrane associated rhomboid family serine protease